MISRRLGVIIVAVAVVTFRPAAPAAQTNGEPIKLVGAAFDINSGWTSHIEIDIKRWSTSEETDRLFGILDERGQEAFASALRKTPVVGTLRVPGYLGYDLRFASRTSRPDGGHEIMLGTDRNISVGEIANQTRTVQYPFIWGQIHVNGDGQGEGELSTLAKLISAGSTKKGGRDIVLENYDITKPVMLRQLREEKLK